MTKVLIADDDQSIREMLKMMLETFDYEVHVVTDGFEALEVLRNSSDRLIVLLDLFMPRLSGLEVLHLIAADTKLSTRHSYILLSASHNPQLFAQNGVSFSFPINILAKPFAMDDLLSAVGEAALSLSIPLPAIA